MSALKTKNRHRLSKKEVKALEEELVSSAGFVPFQPDSQIDVAEMDRWTVILDGGEVVGIYIDDKPFPTLRGLLRRTPPGKHVTVDMGAVKFIANGADVMSPGITDADQAIREGDVVWVRDVKNSKPIAVGIALKSGADMVNVKQGKAVKTLHYVGDEIWNIGQSQAK
jgi:PUA-domain protein